MATGRDNVPATRSEELCQGIYTESARILPWKGCLLPSAMPRARHGASRIPGQLVLSCSDPVILDVHVSKLRLREIHCLLNGTEFVPGKSRILTSASLAPKALLSLLH